LVLIWVVVCGLAGGGNLMLCLASKGENEVMVVLMEEEFHDTNCEVLVEKDEKVMNIEDVTMSLNFLVDFFFH
jgi:orotate phosphoribosyltransferase